jgi:hypothetical protein
MTDADVKVFSQARVQKMSLRSAVFAIEKLFRDEPAHGPVGTDFLKGDILVNALLTAGNFPAEDGKKFMVGFQ